jgi:hypothetical protein
MKSVLEKETAVRVNVTVSPRLARFLDDYQERFQLESRSAVVSLAIQTLKDADMERGYAELGAYQRQHLESFIGLDSSDGFDLNSSKIPTEVRRTKRTAKNA